MNIDKANHDLPEPAEADVISHWSALPGEALITVLQMEHGIIVAALTKNRRESWDLSLQFGPTGGFAYEAHVQTVEDATDYLEEHLPRFESLMKPVVRQTIYVTRRGYGYDVTTSDHRNILFHSFDRNDAIAKAREIAPDPEDVSVNDRAEDEW